MIKKLISLVVVLCMISGTAVFGAASDQGCSSSGNTAAGCGGTTNNGGNGGNGGQGGTGGSGGNATVGNVTNTANGGSSEASSSGGELSSEVSLDASDNSYSYSAPSLDASVGTEALQFHTIFGGISLANSEDYVVQIEELDALTRLVQAKIITPEEARASALRSIKRLHWSSRPKRILGIGPKSRGKHLLNFFGLLATDSYREDK